MPSSVEIGSSLDPEESLIQITDSSGSFNTPEPPEKQQRAESGGVPTSSKKSQSIRPPCSVAKARVQENSDIPIQENREIPAATDAEPITTSIVSVVASDVGTVSVASSRYSALLRARELTRLKNQNREAEAEAAAAAEAAAQRRAAAEAERAAADDDAA